MISAGALLVMCKAPRRGLAKTRLAPLLGERRCADLQAALIARTVAVVTSVAPAATYVAVEPPDALADVARLVPRGVVLLPQRGRHLGERLTAAATDVAAAHHGPLVVVGTDVPLLDAPHLRRAFETLGTPGTVVLGPARDGGYYLIGTARPEPSLFAIEPGLWGGPEVLTATQELARAAGLHVRLLDTLRDLDTPDDVEALCLEAALEPELRALLCTPPNTPGDDHR